MLPFLWHSALARESGLLLLALLLGGLVGWERERHEHPAGLRTHALVCVGSALVTIVGNGVPNNGGRIAAQIVTGIGFLGAGTILRDNSGSAVRGLTTAASVWTTAGIGIAVGLGGLDAQIAAVATVLVLSTLTLLSRVEAVLSRRRRRQFLTLVFRPDADTLTSVSRVLGIFHERDIKTRDLTTHKSADSDVVTVQISLSPHTTRDSLDPALASDIDIIHHEWKD